jgi:hypothetical protein
LSNANDDEPGAFAPGSFQPQLRSDALQVRGRQLAALAHHIKTDLLAFVEGAHPGALDRGDVDEYILPAIRRLYESKPFLRIEKLHRTLSHIWPPLKTPIGVLGYTTIA